jgi:hypothetical protein
MHFIRGAACIRQVRSQLRGAAASANCNRDCMEKLTRTDVEIGVSINSANERKSYKVVGAIKESSRAFVFNIFSAFFFEKVFSF